MRSLHNPVFVFEKTLPVGGFEWHVHIVGPVAIVRRPEDFPEDLPLPWEPCGVIQLLLPEMTPPGSASHLIYHWHAIVERKRTHRVINYIKRELMKPLNKKRAAARKSQSRSKAPCRRSQHCMPYFRR